MVSHVHFFPLNNEDTILIIKYVWIFFLMLQFPNLVVRCLLATPDIWLLKDTEFIIKVLWGALTINAGGFCKLQRDCCLKVLKVRGEARDFTKGGLTLSMIGLKYSYWGATKV